MKPVKTWILVADSARARIFLNEGPGRGIEELKEHASDTAATPPREIDTDRPGRVFDSAGPGRHALERSTGPQRQAKRDFAAHIAERLKAALEARAFDRLVVMAAPVTLGDLRKELPKEVMDRLRAEVPKDLTHADDDEIAKQLGAVLAV